MCSVRSVAPSLTLLVGAALAGVLAKTAGRAQTTELDRFVGRDFWRQRLSAQEFARVHELTRNESMLHPTGPQPWRLWKIGHAPDARYIFLLGAPLFIIPGVSSANVQLLDSSAKTISTWTFQTGWRIDLVDAWHEYSSALASDLIVLQTLGGAISDRYIAKEYFAISRNQLRLVRLEGNKGELVQNEYVFPNYEIGFVPAAKSVGEWADLLESKNNADVLSALVFLGGRHIDAPDREFGIGPHESRYSDLFRRVITTSRIRDRIRLLMNSENEWVRQAAAFAARGPRDRLFE